VAVALPVAMAVAGNHDLACCRDARAETLEKAATDVRREARTRRRVPAEHRLARDLVDVLPAGPRALHELEDDFSVRESHCRRSWVGPRKDTSRRLYR